MVNRFPDDPADLAEVELPVGALEARALQRRVPNGSVPDGRDEEVTDRREALAAAKRFAYPCGCRGDYAPVEVDDRDAGFTE